MGTIIELTGADLQSMLRGLGVPDAEAAEIWHVRVAIDGGFKISVNHGSWSPPLGKVWK